MNQDLVEAVKAYATCDHEQVVELLHGKSKGTVVSILIDLLTEYFNDKNSSTLREFVVVSLSGFAPSKRKIGYNGYRQDSISGSVQYCEAKPKNIDTNRASAKLDGGGNFTDYSWDRFERDKRENPTMVIGGFIDGRLVYIFRFAFCSVDFLKRLERQLQVRFPDGDRKNEYLRSASFGLKDYQNTDGLECNVFVDGITLEKYKKYMTKGVYATLEPYV
ncbi:MAG: hypothetical protein F4X82_03545 [Candidatus Spechtbacteria bacterium SB0662_bin_43]|uniref:Uncharacterized protein n=1 Tax=Candidatus Spechtbacteria bacterium SB0662_bin_43 TaxID=2604897 RepID=A0A845DAP3_9BACT|nr:hypothetical protein [Candidatus Spechtbacteria bacterium SB0662_bin_43]